MVQWPDGGGKGRARLTEITKKAQRGTLRARKGTARRRNIDNSSHRQGRYNEARYGGETHANTDRGKKICSRPRRAEKGGQKQATAPQG